MVIMTAFSIGTPFMHRNSSVLSSIAESEPATSMTGRILRPQRSMKAECMFSSRASMRLRLPRIVLISPLCAIM